MSADWFLKLKEFDSLEKMRISHLKGQKEQNERLLGLNIKRQDYLHAVADLQKELHTLQQEYFESEKKLKSLEEQASRLRDIGGDLEKIKHYQGEASELENALFNLLDKTEAVQMLINEKKTFLSGLDKTIQEIETEVKSENEEHSKAITQLNMRQQLIKDELPPDFKEALERTLKKNLALGPFTRVEKGSCFFCRYKISRIDESEIDMQKSIKYCPQCSRLFLPYGS